MGFVAQIKADSPPDAWLNSIEVESPLRFQAADGSFYLTDDELLQVRELHVPHQILRKIRETELPVRFLLPHDGAVHDGAPEDARLAVLARLLAEERASGSVDVCFLGRNRIVPADGFVLDRAGGQRRYVWRIVPAEADTAIGAAERFRALRRLCGDPDTKLVLSLGSGGLKLFAHATALRLFEAIGLSHYVREIWGSSAGAMAGLLYAQGLSPQAIEQMGYDLYTGRIDLALRPSRLQFLRHLLRDALLPATGAEGAGFVDCAASLESMLDRYCAEAEPRIPFFSVAFNLTECRPEVLTAEAVPEHLHQLHVRVSARNAALASATVPLLFVPRAVRSSSGSSLYIDGSTTEDVPLHSVARKWDRDRAAGVEARSKLVILYVKLTSGLSGHRAGPGSFGKLRLMQTIAAASIETMHLRDVELLSARSDVTLLGLTLSEEGPDFFETRRIAEFIRAAKETFPEQLAAIEARLRSS